VRRTMHILDSISSVSKSSNCTKIVGGWGLAQDPTGELTALPNPIGILLRPLRLRGEEKRGGEGAKMIHAPETLSPPLLMSINFLHMLTCDCERSLMPPSFSLRLKDI